MTNILRETPKPSVRSRAMTGVALSAVSLAMTLPGFALAADESSGVSEITVTGSRIKAPNLTSDSPITAVSAEEIKAQGTTNIENLLNNLPSVVGDITNVGYNAGGAANVNLRGLGATRTLVLIDGQRVGPTSAINPAVDLNFIPASLVQSIELLTGGASSVYGSDAIAGVINFHLLKDFEGVMIDSNFTGHQHSNNNPIQSVNNAGIGGTAANPNPGTIKYNNGNTWDGFIRDNTAVLGVNAPDNKGNVTMYAEYRATTSILGPQRDTSACQLSTTTAAPGRTCSGSSTGPYGKFKAAPGVLAANGISTGITLADDPAGTRSFIVQGKPQYFNFASTSYLQAQDDRTSIGANGHYKVTNYIELYSSLMFMHDANLSQIGPDPIAGSSSSTPPFTQLSVACSQLGNVPSPDPRLKGLTQQQLLGCFGPTGHATTMLASTPLINVPALRLSPSLPRETSTDRDNYRAVAGARGDINEAFSYDASANFFASQYQYANINYPTIANYSSALASGALDPFQYNPAVQTPQEASLGALGTTNGKTRDYDLVAAVTGDLGVYGVKSPLASSSMNMVAGLEYRRSEVTLSPDGLLQTGALLGQSAVHGFSGAEANKEAFGEFRAPLIEHKPFVETLDLNLALRHTETEVDNTGNNFSANTWKISADYAPDTQLRFRGGFNKADRAPDVYELFNPQLAGGGLGGPYDPCAVGAPNPAGQAACTNPNLPVGARVPSSAFVNGVSTITQCTSQQCNLTVGGNTALKPEKAETWTWGVNLTPDFIKGLSASVDYWDIKVDNYIGTIPSSAILNGCYTTQPGYCQFIHREGTGIYNGINYGTGAPYNSYSLDNTTIGGVVQTNQNVDSLHNTGVDFDISYRRNIADFGMGLPEVGSIGVNFLGTYTMEAKTQVIDSVATYDCAGYFGTNCFQPTPVWRHTMRVTWSTPWNADFSVNWRHLSGVSLDSNSPSQPNYVGAGNLDLVDAKIPAYDYIDLSASYVLWGKYTFRVGVNNLMDKDPPVLTATATGGPGIANGSTLNGYGSTYDSLGRTIFTSFNAKF